MTAMDVVSWLDQPHDYLDCDTFGWSLVSGVGDVWGFAVFPETVLRALRVVLVGIERHIKSDVYVCRFELFGMLCHVR